MDKLRNHHFVVLGLAVATYVVSSSGICQAQGSSPQAAPQPTTQNVNVVNSSVPVNLTSTPTVNVGTMPAVNANVSNTPLTALITKDPDNPARHPVAYSATISLDPGTDFANEPGGYIVPVGKRLVIDTVSAQVFVPAGQELGVDVVSGVGLTSVFLYPPLNHYTAWSSTTSLAVGTVRVQSYADAGSSVLCQARRLPASGGGITQAYCQWSGHLVDLP